LARRRFAAIWAGLAVVLAAVLSLVVGLAVNAVPKSWGWAHDW
jgi:F0F1-type ATP synthase membrane subunit c/vacuolar-type H+-ATPase subunit K